MKTFLRLFGGFLIVVPFATAFTVTYWFSRDLTVSVAMVTALLSSYVAITVGVHLRRDV